MQDKQMSDLPKGIDPYGTEKYGSAMQKTDSSRKSKEGGTLGRLVGRGIGKWRFIKQKTETQAEGP